MPTALGRRLPKEGLLEERPMPRQRKTWIVMADGSRARILTRRAEAPGFEVVSDLAAEEARLPTRDITAHKPGRAQESAYSGRHAVEPRSDAHQERKSAFLRSLAERLNRAAGEALFDDLILFAPPRALGELRQALEDGTRAKIKAEAPKDLTNTPIAELPEHLDALRQ
jgi:protein required for attachment to host cells